MLNLYKNIKAKRLELGLSQGELAKLTGYTDRSSIAKVEAGRVDLSQSKIKAFANALHTTPQELMGWDGESAAKSIPAGFEPLPEMSRVPLIGHIACGDPIMAEENVEDIVSVPAIWHADFTLHCEGDSMFPRIQDGDLVAIRAQPQVENGEVAAVRIDNEATLKHVYYYPDYIELRPENPNFASIIKIGEAMNEVHIEGKAVGLCRGL